MRRWLGFTAVVGLGLLALGIGSWAQERDKVVNIYSARHYQTDEQLYAGFTKSTGIKVNWIEGDQDGLLERIRNEGRNSPADLFVTVDVGRLWRAEQTGLLSEVRSEVLEARVPASLRHPEGRWYGFSTRARVIFHNKELVDPQAIGTYEDLADPRWKGLVCIRSSSNIYNLSLLASLIAHHGAEAAEVWAAGVVANFARDPVGGDTDQLRGLASGECGIALANTYYFARLMRSDSERDKALVKKIGVIFPNQEGRGAHVNISGAAVVRTAPHPDNARLFLEYLTSREAQIYFAGVNNEYPIVDGLDGNQTLKKMGAFKADTINIAVFGKYQAEAQRIFDRVGWK
jgi:iron(III) transport system substrate-binding protein